MTTGAENDLKQVTDLARAMVTRWGMSPEVGLMALSGTEEGNFLEPAVVGSTTRPYSEETAEAIDAATRRIIDECYAKAREALTQALLRDESLDEEQMLHVTGLPARALPRNAIAANR